MQVAPVSFANFGKINNNTLLKSNTAANTALQNNTNSYTLPGYNVSFGALIKEYDKNPGVMLNREERKELDDEVQEIIKYEGSEDTEIKDKMLELFEKYHNNKAAMKYILSRAINKPVTKNSKFNNINESTHEPYTDFIKAYINTVNSYFKDNTKKRREFLRTALFTKNLDGNTLAHATLKPSGPASSGLLSVIFEETKNDPDIQVQVLKDARTVKYGNTETTETIGQRMGQMLPHTEDGVIINDALHKLCAKTRLISRQTSIELLLENKKMLNDHNKEVLEALQSKDCICVEASSKKANDAETIAADRTQEEYPPEQHTEKVIEARDKDANNTDKKLKSKPKEIEVMPFFNNSENHDRQKTGYARADIRNGELEIPDFLKSDKYSKKTGTSTTKRSTKTAIRTEQTGGIRQKGNKEKELQVLDFSSPRSKSVNAVTEDTDTKIRDFSASQESYDSDPSINWGLQMQACDG